HRRPATAARPVAPPRLRRGGRDRRPARQLAALLPRGVGRVVGVREWLSVFWEGGRWVPCFRGPPRLHPLFTDMPGRESMTSPAPCFRGPARPGTSREIGKWPRKHGTRRGPGSCSSVESPCQKGGGAVTFLGGETPHRRVPRRRVREGVLACRSACSRR